MKARICFKFQHVPPKLLEVCLFYGGTRLIRGFNNQSQHGEITLQMAVISDLHAEIEVDKQVSQTFKFNCLVVYRTGVHLTCRFGAFSVICFCGSISDSLRQKMDLNKWHPITENNGKTPIPEF